MNTKSTYLRRLSSVRQAAQRGLTLIEFLIAIGLGLMIVSALSLLIAQQSATQAEFEKSSRQIENGRYAMQILGEDLQVAGYWGEFSNTADLPKADMPNPCVTAVTTAADKDGLEYAMAFPVQGIDSAPGSAAVGIAGCIAAANHQPGTDILIVRRLDTSPLTIAQTASNPDGQVYVQAGLTAAGLEFLKVMGKGPATVAAFNLYQKGVLAVPPVSVSAPLRKFLVHIYFVSPCSVPASGVTCSGAADGGKPIPTLKMLELSTSGATTQFTTTSLVEGVEHMQVDYGFDTDGDGSPDGQFKSGTAVAAEWPTVMGLRVHLLVRNIEASPGYVDGKTYALGYNSAAAAQTLSPTTDAYGNNVRAFKRHVFTQTLRLVNPAGRLDK